MDSRIGKHGGDGPGICAVTLQPCSGQHASHYSIGNGYYITIMEKVAMGMSTEEIEKVRKECRKLISDTKRAAKVAPTNKTEES